jgi:hypothetical protein
MHPRASQSYHIPLSPHNSASSLEYLVSVHTSIPAFLKEIASQPRDTNTTLNFLIGECTILKCMHQAQESRGVSVHLIGGI